MSAFEMPGATAGLVADPGESQHVEVAVYDGRLEPLPLFHNLGRVELKVVPGAYKVEFRTGAETSTQIVVVSEGETREVRLEARIRVASAAPVQGSTTSHEYQQGPAFHESIRPPLSPPAGEAGGSSLFLFVRDHDENAWTGENPAAGLSLHRLDGSLLYDLDRVRGEGVARDDDDPGPPRPRTARAVYRGDLPDAPAPGGTGLARYSASGHWTALHAELDPGAYLLRLRTANEGVLQQVVHLAEGWQTQLFLLARSYGRGTERRRQGDLARGSVFMTRDPGFQPGEQPFYLTEVALRALADGRSLPGPHQADMMGGRTANPMMGLYSGYLHLRLPRMDPWVLRPVFLNLHRLLGPHPDVIALGWAIVARWQAEGVEGPYPGDGIVSIRQAVEAAGPMDVPPMLRASADAIARASFTNPGLVAPDSLAERVTTRMLLAGPWLLWTATADELRETPLPPAAAPRVQETLDKLQRIRVAASPDPFNRNSIGFARVVQAWEAPRTSASFAPPAPQPPSRSDDPGTGMSGASGGGLGDEAESVPGDEAETGWDEDSTTVPADAGTVLAGIQRCMDAIGERLEERPALAKQLVDDASLTPLERRVALAAFPQTDPLFAAMTRRRSPAISALLQGNRPTAEELAATLGAPAGTLSRAMLGLAERVQSAE